MANYKGHMAGGVVSGALVAGTYYYLLSDGDVNLRLFDAADWQLAVYMIAISTLFSLWPDVDTNSKAQNLFFRVAFVVDIALIISGLYLAAALLGLLAMTPILGKHRGWTHAKLSCVLVPLPIIAIPYFLSETIEVFWAMLYIASVVGYFSHLLLDGLIWKRIKVKGGW